MSFEQRKKDIYSKTLLHPLPKGKGTKGLCVECVKALWWRNQHQRNIHILHAVKLPVPLRMPWKIRWFGYWPSPRLCKRIILPMRMFSEKSLVEHTCLKLLPRRNTRVITSTVFNELFIEKLPAEIRGLNVLLLFEGTQILLKAPWPMYRITYRKKKEVVDTLCTDFSERVLHWHRENILTEPSHMVRKACFPVAFCIYYQLHLGSPSYFLILLQFASFQGWGKDGMKEITFDIYIIFTAHVIVSSCKFLAKFFKSLWCLTRSWKNINVKFYGFFPCYYSLQFYYKLSSVI